MTFSNFLLKRLDHLSFAYSSQEDMLKHFESGKVTLPITDVIKLQKEYEEIPNESTEVCSSTKLKLPSSKQIGDAVIVDFGIGMRSENASVIKVHFTESKVMYDLEINFTELNNDYSTRLYNVDSVFVHHKL